MQRIALLAIFSIIFSGCGIPRPDSDLCVVNAPAKHQKCFNLKTDYSDAGTLLPGSVAKFKTANVVDDLNKNICTDPVSWARIKAYIVKLKQHCELE